MNLFDRVMDVCIITLGLAFMYGVGLGLTVVTHKVYLGW